MSTWYTTEQIAALVNWDGLLCMPPFRNDAERRQHYSRYITRYLWRAFSPDDWRQVADIIDDLRVPWKVKAATKFLLNRHAP